MAIVTQNGDYDLNTSAATVYSKVATEDGEYSLEFVVGDNTKKLDDDGCTLTVKVTCGPAAQDAVVVTGTTQEITSDAGNTRVRFRTNPIYVASGDTLAATVESDNAADTDVDVTVTPRTTGVHWPKKRHNIIRGPSNARVDVPIGTALSVVFTIHDPVSGDFVNGPDSLSVYVRTLGDSAFGSLTASFILNITASTYHGYVTFNPADEAVVAGATFMLVVDATVNGVRERIPIIQGRLVPAETTAGQPEVTVASDSQAALVAAVEAALVNDGDATAMLQAIADKFTSEFDIEDLTLAAIASAVRDAILDRVLSGNHDDAGSTGKLLQDSAAKLAGATGTLANTDNAATFKATGFATPENLNNFAVAIGGHITDTVGSLATSTELAAVDAKIDDVLEDTGTTLPAAITGVWTADDRTLTGGGGTSAPTAQTEDEDAHVSVKKGFTRLMRRRVRKWNSDDITQDYISTITYTAYLLDRHDADERTAITGHTAVSVSKVDVIYDTLQTDNYSADWNFSHIPEVDDAPLFTIAGRMYLVEYTITPTDGSQEIPVRFFVSCI